MEEKKTGVWILARAQTKKKDTFCVKFKQVKNRYLH